MSAVCGFNCIQDRLHIRTEYYRSRPRSISQACFPALARQLIADQTRKLAIATTKLVPFGLVATPDSGKASNGIDPTDLYLPLASRQHGHGHALYRGADRSLYAFQCDSLTWVVSSLDDERRRSECAGDLWFDLRSNTVTSSRPASSSETFSIARLIFRFDFWTGCDRSLPQSPGARVSFAAESLPEEVACWFSRAFSPQHSTAGMALAETVVTLREGLRPVQLQTDIVVRNGSSLRVHGQNTTFLLNSHRISVERGGRLELDGIVLADSVGASALWVETARRRPMRSISTSSPLCPVGLGPICPRKEEASASESNMP